MVNCWQAEVSDRPSFAELQASLDVLLTNAQSENYIDLNVDEMLPYYHMKSIQGDDEELDERDLKPNDGYPDTAGLNHGYLQDIQRPDSNSSEASISSHDVNVQNAKESEHGAVSTDGFKQEEEQAPTDTNPGEMNQTLTFIPDDYPTLTSSGPEESSKC